MHAAGPAPAAPVTLAPVAAPTSGANKLTKIVQLRHGMKSVNVRCIVLEKGEPFETKERLKVADALVADETASIRLSLFEKARSLEPGDIALITNGYSSLFKGQLVLNVGKSGTIERVGEFAMSFSEVPFMSKIAFVADPSNPSLLIPKDPAALNVQPLPSAPLSHPPPSASASASAPSSGSAGAGSGPRAPHAQPHAHAHAHPHAHSHAHGGAGAAPR